MSARAAFSPPVRGVCQHTGSFSLVRICRTRNSRSTRIRAKHLSNINAEYTRNNWAMVVVLDGGGGGTAALGCTI